MILPDDSRGLLRAKRAAGEHARMAL